MRRTSNDSQCIPPRTSFISKQLKGFNLEVLTKRGNQENQVTHNDKIYSRKTDESLQTSTSSKKKGNNNEKNADVSEMSNQEKYVRYGHWRKDTSKREIYLKNTSRVNVNNHENESETSDTESSSSNASGIEMNKTKTRLRLSVHHTSRQWQSELRQKFQPRYHSDANTPEACSQTLTNDKGSSKYPKPCSRRGLRPNSWLTSNHDTHPSTTSNTKISTREEQISESFGNKTERNRRKDQIINNWRNQDRLIPATSSTVKIELLEDNEKHMPADNKSSLPRQENNDSERTQEKTNPEVRPRDVEIYVCNQDSPIYVAPKHSNVDDVTGYIHNMFKLDGSSSLTFFHGDKELKCSNDFEHVLGSTSYPVRLDVVIHPAERIPEESLRKFNLHDMIDGDLTDDSTVMVQMSCGHATTPENLYDYCLSEIRRKRTEVSCLVNGCEEIWYFGEISRKACLSDSERHLFEVRLSQNAVLLEKNIFCCPSCGLMIDISSTRSRWYFRCSYCKSGKFCRTCHLPMSGYTCTTPYCSKPTLDINTTLTGCQKKTIIGVPGCPTVRACPSCKQLIQHTGDLCKHMDCLFCKSRFCFICLSVKTGDYWTCGGAYDPCSVANIQQV